MVTSSRLQKNTLIHQYNNKFIFLLQALILCCIKVVLQVMK